jgi:diaminohydroxyphosphoribosylaminopyrimidine deaminase/5-amino-6-(5-phosphoribosylamino)uracil reductase
LAEAFYRENLVQRALFFVAPKIIGGQNALTPVDGDGLAPVMAGAIRLGPFTVRKFAPDIALCADVLPM